ncbi:MAG: hypothetical protein ACOVOX_13200, partial [Burkholderiaceae bacterium]
MSPWRQRWRAQFGVYSARDPVSAEIRAKHVAALVRMTPFNMLANALSGFLVVWSIGPSTSPLAMALWLSALLLMCAMGMWSWHSGRSRTFVSVSPKAVRRATVHAGLLAATNVAPPTEKAAR